MGETELTIDTIAINIISTITIDTITNEIIITTIMRRNQPDESIEGETEQTKKLLPPLLRPHCSQNTFVIFIILMMIFLQPHCSQNTFFYLFFVVVSFTKYEVLLVYMVQLQSHLYFPASSLFTPLVERSINIYITSIVITSIVIIIFIILIVSLT